jgi:hypothetical protein
MRLLLIFFLLPVTGSVNAQQKNAETDTSYLFLKKKPESSFIEKETSPKPTIRSLAVPLTLITYGFVSLTSDPLQDLDISTKNEIREDHPLFHTKIDNYLQYAPAVAVYGLNAIGIKGKNNFRDRTMIYLLSKAISGISVRSLKSITQVQRPDSSGANAFPSGHTATAFAGAEFLRQEYKDVSPWYGIAGYTVAIATGILRMYNNKHWLGDVVAGAGFGILSTQIAYWLEPKIAKMLFHKKTSSQFRPSNY